MGEMDEMDEMDEHEGNTPTSAAEAVERIAAVECIDETTAGAPTPTPERTDARDSRMLRVPTPSLVVLVGASGSGKSTFAARHFRPTEVLSSDAYRAIVSDDENELGATAVAFETLQYVAGRRLQLGRLTVVDATSVKPQDRASLIALAREYDVPAIALVLNLDERTCLSRNAARNDRRIPAHAIRNHARLLRQGLRGIEREGFASVTVLSMPAQVDALRIERVPLPPNRRDLRGPFDIVGDVHGCYDELHELLGTLGYVEDAMAGMRAPHGRMAVFLGDLVDRGPQVVATVRLVTRMVAAGQALFVPGNHDEKLRRYLRGRNVERTFGIDKSIAEIEALPSEERAEFAAAYLALIDHAPSHLVLAGGALVVAHGGMREAAQGRDSRRVRALALYGEATGEVDDQGLSVRAAWAADYRGKALVVFGHVAVPAPTWLNNTVDIDTGCVYGGALTALRWPERECVSVPARATYAEPPAALITTPAATPEHEGEGVTDILPRIEDVSGKQLITTRLSGTVGIEADRAAAALEVLSRYALDPRWLVYLPPTMSPSETSREPGYLEYPTEAFTYYHAEGVEQVICEEKHMGSRAVLVICRDAATAARRFGVGPSAPAGVIYTRTGRQFFEEGDLVRAVVTRVGAALGRAGFWERFETDWVALDAEVMPWNLKAQGLLREQYAPVAAAGRASLAAAVSAVETAEARGVAVGPLLARLRTQLADIDRYAMAYRRYCWDVQGIEGIRIAPFQLLATEGKTHLDRDHLWHLTELARLAEADPLFQATTYRVVALDDEVARAEATAWWCELTGKGGEGMVVKPLAGIVRGKRGIVQPAVKCRGREYLRIIYGPSYTEEANLTRLRTRSLGAKRALASREFALGVEALERFVAREPLYRVHQAVFGVLALESEPVDPRL